MKKISIAFLFTLILAVHARSQDTSTWLYHLHSWYSDLDRAQMMTDILYDQALPMAKVSDYNGTTSVHKTSYDNWREMYVEMLEGAWDPNAYYHIDTVLNRARNYILGDTIPMVLAFFNYDYLRSDALSAGLLTRDTIGRKFYDVTGRPESPYKQEVLFSSSATLNDLYQGEYKFFLGSQFIYGNQNWSTYSFRIDFGDGTGFHDITLGSFYDVNYLDTGEIVITLEATSGSTTLTAKSEHHVMYKTSTDDYTAGIKADIGYPIGTEYKSNGLFTIHYGTDPNTHIQHTCVTKPFIIVEGVDYGTKELGTAYCKDGRCGRIGWPDLIHPDKKVLEEYPQLQFYPDALNSISAQGYDIIFLDNHDGATYMERNAMMLVKLLNNINGYDNSLPVLHRCGCEESIILGPSMGGQTSKYALAYMEKNNMDHQVKLYISFDSPHKGANVPIGLQKVIYYFNAAGITPESARDAHDRKLAKPASRELLIYHAEYSSEGHPAAHQDRLDFLSKLSDLGNYPKNLRKIALSSGSRTGANQGYNHNDKVIDDDIIGVVLNWKIQVWALQGNPNYRGYQHVVSHVNEPFRPREIYTVSGTEPDYDNCPGGMDDGWASFHELHQFYSFIPTISGLDMITEDVWDDLSSLARDRPEPSRYPFDAFYAPSGNQRHIDIGTGTGSNMEWVLQQLDLISMESYMDLDNSPGKGHYNYGSTRRVMPPTDISNSAILQINGDYRTNYGTTSDPYPFNEGSNFEVHTLGCGVLVNIQNGGTIKVGDYNTPTANKGTLIIGKGSSLHIYNGGKLTVYDDSKVIIKKGANIAFDAGATIELLGNNAILEIDGALYLGANATFSLSSTSTGFVRFHQEYPTEKNIFVDGTNCSFSLSSDNPDNKVLEVAGGESIYPDESLKLFSVENAKVVLGPNCRLNIACPLTLHTVKIDAISANESDYHRGVHIYGQGTSGVTSVNLNGVTISHGLYGVFAPQFYGNSGASLTDVTFNNCKTGIYSDGYNMTIADSKFDQCSDFGWNGVGMSGTSTVDNTLFQKTSSSTLSGEGVDFLGSTSGTPLSISQSNIKYFNMGLMVENVDIDLNCNRIRLNENGLATNMTTNLYMSTTGSPVGGHNDLSSNNSAGLLLTGTCNFNLNDGYNNFMRPSTSGYTIYADLINCFSFVIPANYNKWTSAGTGPSGTYYGNTYCSPYSIVLSDGYPLSIFSQNCYTGPLTPMPQQGGNLGSSIPADSVQSRLDSLQDVINCGRSLAAGRAMLSQLQNKSASMSDNEFLSYYTKMFYAMHKSISRHEIMLRGNTIPGIIDSIMQFQAKMEKRLKNNSSKQYLRFMVNIDRAGLFELCGKRDSSLSILAYTRSWAVGDQIYQVNRMDCMVAAEDSVMKGRTRKEDFYRLIKPCQNLRDTILLKPFEATFNALPENRYTANGLRIYPNPTSGEVNAVITLSNSQRIRLLLFDIEGRLLKEEYKDLQQGENRIPLSMSDQAPGLYLISIEGLDFLFKEKLILH